MEVLLNILACLAGCVALIAACTLLVMLANAVFPKSKPPRYWD